MDSDIKAKLQDIAYLEKDLTKFGYRDENKPQTAQNQKKIQKVSENVL